MACKPDARLKHYTGCGEDPPQFTSRIHKPVETLYSWSLVFESRFLGTSFWAERLARVLEAKMRLQPPRAERSPGRPTPHRAAKREGRPCGWCPCARYHRGRRRTGRERNGRRASEKRPVDPIRSMPGTKSCIICTLGSPWLVLWRKQHRFFRISLVSAGIPIPPRNSTSPPHHP